MAKIYLYKLHSLVLPVTKIKFVTNKKKKIPFKKLNEILKALKYTIANP